MPECFVRLRIVIVTELCSTVVEHTNTKRIAHRTKLPLRLWHRGNEFKSKVKKCFEGNDREKGFALCFPSIRVYVPGMKCASDYRSISNMSPSPRGQNWARHRATFHNGFRLLSHKALLSLCFVIPRPVASTTITATERRNVC